MTIRWTSVRVAALFAALFSVSCGNSNMSSESPCEGAAPLPGCGQNCIAGAAATCPSGFYCSPDQTCRADCSFSQGYFCGEGFECTDNGRCIGGDGDCPELRLVGERKAPDVWLIIDRSASMSLPVVSDGQTPASPSNPSRWSVLRDVLVGPDGLVTNLQDIVRFGLHIYTDGVPQNINGQILQSCLLTGSTMPNLGNLGLATSVLPQNLCTAPNCTELNWAGATPTGLAVDALFQATDPNRREYWILLTDGEPTVSTDPGTGSCRQDFQRSLSQTTDALRRVAQNPNKNITIVGFGRGPLLSATTPGTINGRPTAPPVPGISTFEQILERLYYASIGLPDGTTAPEGPQYRTATSKAQLEAELRTIVRGPSCDVQLQGGAIVDKEKACATGSVQLNGRALRCNENRDDGEWQVVDNTRIRLLGSACDELLNQPSYDLNADFDCRAAELL